MPDRSPLIKAVAKRLGVPVPTTVEQANAMFAELDKRIDTADRARAAAAQARAVAAAADAVAYPAHWTRQADARSAHMVGGVRGAGPGVDYPADWNLDLRVS